MKMPAARMWQRLCTLAVVLLAALMGASKAAGLDGPQEDSLGIGYFDEVEFQQHCRSRNMQLNLFEFSQDSIQLTTQFSDAGKGEISAGAFLGRELEFPATLTDLPVSFQLSSLGHPASHYSGIVYGHMHDNAGEQHAVLQINSHPENDDFRLAFSTKARHYCFAYVCLRMHAQRERER